jgi:molybdopterin synthase catalytic subunit
MALASASLLDEVVVVVVVSAHRDLFFHAML